ncbi:tyrosine-type recombinase/integrase [Scytonema sp. PCC 10023]|uniref:tyrosine-type recombinase/integrase n=1 Tax=Scytonema sp. PCC 10023 TaxID=1680591 RepID=UPI0039C65CC9
MWSQNCLDCGLEGLVLWSATSTISPEKNRSPISGIVERAGELADLPFPVHAHMLRHGTGYYLANRGTDTRTIQSYLGHNNIQHTVRYTKLASGRFQGLWDG